jgi:hypothetical protein
VVAGTCSPAATSSAATLTVITPVSITAQPANVELCSGTTASFTVAGSSNQTIIYQWQVSTDGGTSWTNIAATNSASLTLNNVTAVMNNNRYRCLLSTAACTTASTSNAAILTVRITPTASLTQSPVLSELLPGKTSTLTASTSASTGGTFSTTWLYNSNPLTVTGNTYTVDAEHTGTYQVRVQENWPGGLSCSALSSVVTLDAAASSRLFIFPTPNDGSFTVSYYNASGASVQRSIVIFDSKGALVYNSKFIVAGPYTLVNVTLPNISTGIYHLVIGDATGKKLAEGKVHIR